MARRQAGARRPKVASVYQMVDVIGPSAGVDLRLSATELPPQRAQTLINFSLEEPGALVVRPGYRTYSTNSLGSGADVAGGKRIYLNTAIPNQASTAFTLVAWNQNVYTLSDTGAFSAPVLPGLSTNQVFFPNDRDLVAVFDGSTRAFKSTNGSSWTFFGIDRPTVGSTLSSLSSGSLSASEFELNFTYKDRDLNTESNGSTSPSTRTLGATGALKIEAPNSTDAQVDAIVVYARNKTSGETVRRKASSFAMGSHVAGTHTTSRILSSAWGTNDEEPTDHDVPTAFSFGLTWKNRWWARDATVTNRIHFSQLFQPQSWPVLFYIDIPFERGDAVQAMYPLGDVLIIFGATSIFLIIGQTSLDFEVRPTIGSQDGALGPRAVCQIENGVVHAGAAGVWIFNGVDDKLLSYDLLPGWQDLIQNATPSQLARVAMVYHQQRKELRIAVPRRFPSGTYGEWILDLSRSQNTTTGWTATDRNIAGYISLDGPEAVTGDRGRLLSWESTGGRIYEEAVGTSANSSNLTAQYAGAGLTLGPHVGRWIDLHVEYEPNSGSLTEQAIVDGIGMAQNTVTIGSHLALVGFAIVGTDVIAGAGRRQASILRDLAAIGRNYVQTFIYQGQAKFRMFAYHLGVVPEPYSRDFSD